MVIVKKSCDDYEIIFSDLTRISDLQKYCRWKFWCQGFFIETSFSAASGGFLPDQTLIDWVAVWQCASYWVVRQNFQNLFLRECWWQFSTGTLLLPSFRCCQPIRPFFATNIQIGYFISRDKSIKKFLPKSSNGQQNQLTISAMSRKSL